MPSPSESSQEKIKKIVTHIPPNVVVINERNNVSFMKPIILDDLGLSAKPTKTPWFLRFAPKAKGIVSFVSNLLPSPTQKEASTAAALLAGLGLLGAPIESVQSAIPKVTEVILTDWALDSDSFFRMEVVHSSGSGFQWFTPKYCWSGVYFDWNRHFGLLDDPWKWVNAEDYSFVDGARRGYHSSRPEKPGPQLYYHPANLWDYYICKIVPLNPFTGKIDKSFGWIEVWFWTGWRDPISGRFYPPSAYVYDSEGNFYHVDLTIK